MNAYVSLPRLCLKPSVPGTIALAYLLCWSVAARATAPQQPAARPNILWISCEDMSPDLGCYGDDYAGTPNLDRLAAQGCRYTNAFVPFPVCAPTRSAIITGIYPGTLGSMHMRTGMKNYEAVPPPYVRCFPEYLRAAGYYCSNHTKTDYQFSPPFTTWDAAKGDWRNPDRPKDAPFFCVINLTVTHESQCWAIDKLDHDPDKVKVPPYYPDTPIVRCNLARYYDNITTMDRQAGAILEKLAQDGLADNTVVFFWSDHGRGLPRCKRSPYDSGLHVPLIVRWPGKIAAGSTCDELVNLIDLAPTVLSIAGVKAPTTLQGRALLGEQMGPPPQYVYGGRNRMDLTSDDFIRTVRDQRYRYIRNFTPDVPYAQEIPYMEKMPIMQEWRRLHAEGKLSGPQRLFFQHPKPSEELYDLQNDPHEINNLAGSPAHQETVKRMWSVLEEYVRKTGDLGGVPEEQLIERMWPGGKQPVTAAPVLQTAPAANGTQTVTITCATEGASIGYRPAGEKRWLVYSGPFSVAPGVDVQAKAIRIGYKASELRELRGAGTVNEAADTGGWQPIGLSGGGAMFTPAISPIDPRLMMVNCDMSCAFLSRDGGQTWQMINHAQLHGHTRCRPCFHPKDVNVIFAAEGYSGTLRVSRDQGQTFAPIGNIPGSLEGEIAIDADRPRRMLAGAAGRVWQSDDAGKTWRKVDGPQGRVLGFHFDRTSPLDRRVCFAATDSGVWRSDDGGAAWTDASAGLPWKGLRGFAGGSNKAADEVMLYCTIPSEDRGGIQGGVYRSANRGQTWTAAMGQGINKDTQPTGEWADGPIAQYHFVLATDVKPRTVYVFNTSTGFPPPHHSTAYRSDDAGKTGRATFYPDPRFPNYNVERDYTTATLNQSFPSLPHGAAIAPGDPECVIQVTGECRITTDGGKTWRNGHTRAAKDDGVKPPAFLNTGLVVTTTWHYYIDPFQANRHYICYTDIGFAHSLDAGHSWRWWRPEIPFVWRNTCYELAFDPEIPGKIWGAFSQVHDIPNGNVITGSHYVRIEGGGRGGVGVSADFAATWKTATEGLPNAPITSLVLDPKSPKNRRTLYATVYGQGVYKSTDDGRTWSDKSRGLGAPSNRRACRVGLHDDGTLLCLITAMYHDRRFEPDGVGLYRSRDAGENWELVSQSQPLLWPKDFAVHPKNSREIYIGAADARGGAEQGGLWRTTDGGATWQRIARKGSQHFGAALHPQRSGWIYMTLCEGAPGAGLWLSKDNGATWQPFDKLPFSNIQRLTFDPADERVLYATTFGGSVWKGPVEP